MTVVDVESRKGWNFQTDLTCTTYHLDNCLEDWMKSKPKMSILAEHNVFFNCVCSVKIF